MFDLVLLNHARSVGVAVREECVVQGIVRDAKRVVGVEYTTSTGTGCCRVYARFIADASGYQSRVAVEIGERIWSNFFRNVAVHGYFYRQDPGDRETQFDILCEAFDEGWMWYIALSDKLTTVGAVVDHKYRNVLQEARHDDLRTFCGAVRWLSSGYDPPR
jgi:halogenation protein CepH